jgi:hypothetical protein
VTRDLPSAIEVRFATPRKLPKATDLPGRVVVLDVAFASDVSGGGFDKITKPFLDGLGDRLAAWVDHHDHELHPTYAADPRFVLARKAEHGACPEMVTPELVERVGPVDTIVCHTDFDGLCSAAKWLRGGREPYEGADDDARAIDTRIGTPSEPARRIDAAIRGRPRDEKLLEVIVRHLAGGLSEEALWPPIDGAAEEGKRALGAARTLAQKFKVVDIERSRVRATLPPTVHSIAFANVTGTKERYDKTELLLLGQARASIAAVVDKDTVTFAAGFDSGVDFLRAFGLSGGMPTLVSLDRKRLGECLATLGVAPFDRMRLES